MSRYDFRWVRRHPLRWVRIMWLPWAVAAVLVGKAVTVGQPPFGLTTMSAAWPILLAVTAGIMASSGIVPLDHKMQAFSASWLFGVSLLRVLTYLDTIWRAGLNAEATVIAAGFALNWALVAIMAVWWPNLLQEAGRDMAVATGVDDRGDVEPGRDGDGLA